MILQTKRMKQMKMLCWLRWRARAANYKFNI